MGSGEKIGAALLLVNAFFWAIGVFMQWRFMRLMRKMHPDVLEQIDTGKRFVRFMWLKEYESLSTTETVTLGRKLRAYTIFYVAFFSAFVVTALFLMNGVRR